MNARIRGLALAAVLASAAVASCRATPARGEVQREWNLTLRELGINPVYPPREDLKIGDVYVRRGNPDAQVAASSPGYLPLDLWVASVDLRDDTVRFYEERTAFPPTSSGARPAVSGEEGRPIEAIADVPSFAQDAAFTGSDVRRMRQVAFPDFLSMTITSGDLRGLVPVEALQVAFGASWEGRHQMSVKIPAAESYGLPALRAAQSILETRASGGFAIRSDFLSTDQLQLLHEGVRTWAATTPGLSKKARQQLLAERNVYLDLITEVFYARSIDIGIATASAAGAEAGASTPIDAAAPRAAADDGPAEAPMTERQQEVLAAEQLAGQLNDRLAAVGQQTLPGGSVRFLSATSTGVSMRRTYMHPIAVGFRSIVLQVDPRTGFVVGAGGQSAGAAMTTGGEASARARIADSIEAWLADVYGPERAYDVLVRTGQARVFEVRQTRGAPLENLEAEIRANRDAILDGIDDGPRSDSAWAEIEAFRAGDFEIELAGG